MTEEYNPNAFNTIGYASSEGIVTQQMEYDYTNDKGQRVMKMVSSSVQTPDEALANMPELTGQTSICPVLECGSERSSEPASLATLIWHLGIDHKMPCADIQLWASDFGVLLPTNSLSTEE